MLTADHYRIHVACLAAEARAEARPFGVSPLSSLVEVP
jgi:hypothetical protein